MIVSEDERLVVITISVEIVGRFSGWWIAGSWYHVTSEADPCS